MVLNLTNAAQIRADALRCRASVLHPRRDVCVCEPAYSTPGRVVARRRSCYRQAMIWNNVTCFYDSNDWPCPGFRNLPCRTSDACRYGSDPQITSRRKGNTSAGREGRW